MKAMVTVCCCVLLCVTCSSCTTLRPREHVEWQQLRRQGVEIEPVKSQAAAALLNLLPGIGNAYLAVGTGEQHEWAWFGFNVLLWPISPVWGIPDGLVSARNINIRQTLELHHPNVPRRLP